MKYQSISRWIVIAVGVWIMGKARTEIHGGA